MNRLSINLSDMTLNPDCFDEETWLIEPSADLSVGAELKNQSILQKKNDDEDLTLWLEGAVKKVDFRTRSALSRRLEKKKSKREKEDCLNGTLKNSLTSIDEVCNESGKDKYITERWLSSSPSSSTSGRNAQRVPYMDMRYEGETDSDENFDVNSINSSLHPTTELYYTPRKIALNSGNYNTLNVPSKNKKSNNLSKSSKSEMQNKSKNINLSQLERKAMEQEQELRMEFINRKERLYVPKNGGETKLQHSRPKNVVLDSAASSASSSVKNLLAASKSFDFRSCDKNNDSTMSLRSNEGSVNDLSRWETRTPNSNTRLPLPRRLAIPGKTGIPLPTPKSAKIFDRQNNAGVSLNDYDDCF